MLKASTLRADGGSPMKVRGKRGLKLTKVFSSKRLSNPVKRLMELVGKCIDALAVRLRSLNLMSRFICVFLIMFLTPIIAMSFYAYSSTSKSLQKEVAGYSELETKIVGQNIHNLLQSYLVGIAEVSFGEELQHKLDNFNKLEVSKKAEFQEELLNNVMKAYMEDDRVSSMAIVAKNGEVLVAKNYNPTAADSLIKLGNNPKSVSGIINLSLTNNELSNQSCEVNIFKSIRSKLHMSVTGYIWLSIKEEALYDIYKNNIKGSDGSIMLIDTKGIVLSSKDKILLGEVFHNNYLIDAVMNSSIKNDRTIKIEDKSYLVTSAKVENTDWHVVSMVSTNYINSESNKIKIEFSSIALGAFIVSLMLSLVISKNISTPLKKLMVRMERAKLGDLRFEEREYSKDEIDEVNLSFNEMIKNISNIINNTKVISRDVLRSTKEITLVSESSYAITEEISASMEEVAKAAAEQVEGMLNCTNYISSLSGAIYDVEESLKVTESFINETRALGEKTKDATSILEEKSDKTRQISESIALSMRELNSHMKEIEKVTKQIADISDNTNFLSLNASIEAARAGEAGRGFTIVAKAVSKLAAQSKSASNKINKITDGLTKKVLNISEKVSNAEAIIRHQEEAVAATNNDIISIIEAMRELSDNINNILIETQNIHELREKTLSSIEDISAISQQTLAITEEVTASTQEQINDMETLSSFSISLDEIVKKLNDTMKVFKTIV